MPNQTAHGSMYMAFQSKFLSAEVNRSWSMNREDRASFVKSLLGSQAMAYTGLTVSATGSGLQVQVAAGEGVDGAGYPIFVPATKPATAVPFGMAAEGSDPVVTLDAAHATLPRIDLVCLRAATLLTDFASVAVSDGTTTTNQTVAQTKLHYFQIVKVTGTPAASPVAPSPLLATDLVLAQVAVAAAATNLTGGNITDKRKMLSGVAVVSATNTWSQLQTFAAGLAITGGTVTGDGSGLTTLNPANLSVAVPISKGGTGQTTAAAGFNALMPLTTLGDVLYASGANTAARLAGNTTATRKFLRQTGTGTVSAAPAWDTLQTGDIPDMPATTSARGTVKVSTAPASAGDPIAVGDNDARMAPAGTSGAGVVSGGTKIQSGKSTSGAGSASTGTITFPTAFSAAPVVPLPTLLKNGTTLPYFLTITSVTATGFSWRAYANTTLALTTNWDEIHWQAIGT